MSKLVLEYFYGKEAEQFSFYRIPKALFTDDSFKNLSSDAKVLYGILLDRMGLSLKNGWLDDENRVFIYFTIENIMETMNWGNKKSIKVLAELDSKKGIGLIEKKRQGLGRPSKIYVKSFIVDKFVDNSVENLETESKNSEKDTPEMSKGNFKKCQNDTSRDVEKKLQEMSKGHSNNTDINKTNINDTDVNNINPILSDETELKLAKKIELIRDDRLDGYEINSELKDYKFYEKLIKKNIEYDYYRDNFPTKFKTVDSIFNIMLDVCTTKDTYINVNGSSKLAEIVKSVFLKIEQEHIDYILETLDKNPSDIRNIRSYLITVIYNAYLTKETYYDTAVNNMLYGSRY